MTLTQLINVIKCIKIDGNYTFTEVRVFHGRWPISLNVSWP